MTGELLLVGSIPVQTAEEAFLRVGKPLGQWLDYMPDGEVGLRSYWIDGLAYRVYNGHPDLETIKRPAPDDDGVEWWKPRGRHDEFAFRVRPGISKVRFGDPGWRLGYTRDAVNSYAIFRYLKKEGAIPQHVRFQVCLPLSYSAAAYFFPEPGDVERVVPGMTAALRAEIAKMVELIPAEDLAIQWDLAIENRLIDNKLATEGPEAARREAQRVTTPASEIPIPGAVALGHHACFGTLEGWPSRRPASLMGVVLLLNAAVAASDRRVDFLHFPTLGSSDDAFFAPLQELRTQGARTYIGAIHHLHGAPGLGPQLKAARKYLPDFGVAAPCGWGRAPERPGRLLSEQDGKITDPVGVIVRDHEVAVAALREVIAG
jgi:hypothetical protein